MKRRTLLLAGLGGIGAGVYTSYMDAAATIRYTTTQIEPSSDDIKLVRELVKTTVLPRWQQRCNQHCREMWDSTIGSVPSDMPLPNSR